MPCRGDAEHRTNRRAPEVRLHAAVPDRLHAAVPDRLHAAVPDGNPNHTANDKMPLTATANPEPNPKHCP